MPKPTFDEAVKELKNLEPHDRELFEEIKTYCADCRKKNLRIRRHDVREKFKCGNDKIVFLMGILEAIEGSEATNSGAGAGPQVPPDVAATAKADFDRIQQTYGDAFLRALSDQSEQDRQAFQAEIDSGKVALRVMTDKFADAEEMNYALSADLRVSNEANVQLTAELVPTRAERDGAVDQVTMLTSAKDASEQRVTTLGQEIADVRQLNSLLYQEQIEIKQQRNEFKEAASLVPDLRVELTKCKAQLEVCTAEVQQYRSTSFRTRDEHTRELAQVRQDHKSAQDDARARIIELEKLLATLLRRPVDA